MLDAGDVASDVVLALAGDQRDLVSAGLRLRRRPPRHPRVARPLEASRTCRARWCTRLESTGAERLAAIGAIGGSSTHGLTGSATSSHASQICARTAGTAKPRNVSRH